MRSLDRSESDILKRDLVYNGRTTDPVQQILATQLPGDVHPYLARVAHIVYAMAENPFTTQRELMQQTGLSAAELRKVNAALRESPDLQQLIVREGTGRKYWDTILPLVQSGAVDAVVNDRPMFPQRISIFPGQSCMYFCGFCGRNTEAKYTGEEIKEGNTHWPALFEEIKAHPHATLSISGGLEPLTNQGIGTIVSEAKQRGIRVPIITNAHILTPKVLANQPGLWETSSLRVSLYGVDDPSYEFVTRAKGAYTIVTRNVADFLRERNNRGAPVQVGLNYIVLPETVDHLPRLIDTVAAINAQVPDKGIDFLAIREDFGSVTGQGLTIEGNPADSKKRRLPELLGPQHRQHLIEVFADFNAKRDKLCPGLPIDLGYAMAALNDGVLGHPLAKARYDEMRPGGFPQVGVVVDAIGDVFLYREAGFLRRPGNQKFRIGRISPNQSLEDVVTRSIERGDHAVPGPGDTGFMDAFDHTAMKLVNQAADDQKTGIPFEEGPIAARRYDPNTRWTPAAAQFGSIHQ